LERHTYKEAKGDVIITKRQLDTIVKAATGVVTDERGSTKTVVEKKILKGTGWKRMKFIQLCCRFAYKHGIVRW
jgi:dTDP-4-dehydrorhamnose 3,5-epimerase-like enzyme